MAGRMNKDTVPGDFTLPLVLTDLIPVFFFGLSCLLTGNRMHSPLFSLGASVCMAAGSLKVLWKLIVVLEKRNIWPLFIQMRIFMPLGFLIMIISLVLHRQALSARQIGSLVFQFPSVLFFAAGLAGMILMSVFAVRLDSSNVRSNWIEQLTNGAAQVMVFIGILLIH